MTPCMISSLPIIDSWLPCSLDLERPKIAFDPSLMLGVSSYGPEMSVDLPFPVTVRMELEMGLRPQVQNEPVNSGRRIGMLTVMIPTIVSRTPQLLMVIAEGLAESVRTTRMMAAAMTKAPEDRRRPMTIFLRR